jgi:hypothetical protein
MHQTFTHVFETNIISSLTHMGRKNILRNKDEDGRVILKRIENL